MPIPNAVSNRLAAELAAVDANTDLDLLISLIDVGQRSGSDITVAATELLRRANLVDSGTSAIVTSKIAAGLFKIDYPVADLWGAAAGGGGGVEVGQLVSGYFAGNPKYVPANGSRYLVSAYPDMQALLTAGALPTYYEPVARDTINFYGPVDGNGWREMGVFVDGDVILIPQSPNATSIGHLLNVSTDRGVTWRASIPKAALYTSTMPEFTSVGLTSSSQILALCKLDSPGHYGALIVTGISSGNVYYIKTADFGQSWSGLASAKTSVNVSNPFQHSLYYRNGVLLYINSGAAQYSTNLGETWQSLTDATWTTGNVATYHTVTDDGYIIHTNQTTSVVSFQWPATPAGWSTALAFTTTPSKLPAARTTLKKCGGYWIAFSTASNVVYIATSMLGTYGAVTLTGTTGIRDVELLGSDFVFLANTSTGYVHMYSPASATPSAPVLVANTATPNMQDFNSTMRWPLLNTKYPTMLSGTPVVMFRHGRESLSEIIAVSGADNIRHLVTATPTSQNPLICRKYGMWFCSIPTVGTNPAGIIQGAVDFAMRVLHYRSTDGKNWVGIGPGFSGVVDTGTRLLRLDGLGKLQQSTDGINWNTTGVTLPVTSTVVSARLWRVKDVVYYYTSGHATNYASGYLYVSTNGGNTWVAVTGLNAPGSMALAKGSTTYYNGKYIVGYCYNSASPNTLSASTADYFMVHTSNDGIAFSSVYNASIGVSTYNPTKVAVMVVNGILWVFAGSMSGSNQNLILVSGDGRVFGSGFGSNFTNRFVGASIIDFDCSNGDLRWMFDELVTVGSTSHRVLNVYKDDVVEILISYVNGNAANYVSGVGGAEGHYMGLTLHAALVYSPESAAFLAPQPNSGTSPMASPYLRVAA